MPTGKQGCNGPAISGRIAQDRPGLCYKQSPWNKVAELPFGYVDGFSLYDATGGIVLWGGCGQAGQLPYNTPIHFDIGQNIVTQGPAYPGYSPEGGTGAVCCVLNDGRLMTRIPGVANANYTAPRLYDPSARVWTTGAAAPRQRHQGDLYIPLNDGTVLSIGGTDPGTGLAIPEVDIYDPVADSWITDTATIPAGALTNGTNYMSWGVTLSGKVLMFAQGGLNGASLLTWDPAPTGCTFTANFWQFTKANQQTPRKTQTAQGFGISGDGLMLAPPNASVPFGVTEGLETIDFTTGGLGLQILPSGYALLGSVMQTRPYDGASIVWDTFTGQDASFAGIKFQPLKYQDNSVVPLPKLPVKVLLASMVGHPFTNVWYVMGGALNTSNGLGQRGIYKLTG